MAAPHWVFKTNMSFLLSFLKCRGFKNKSRQNHDAQVNNCLLCEFLEYPFLLCCGCVRVQPWHCVVIVLFAVCSALSAVMMWGCSSITGSLAVPAALCYWVEFHAWGTDFQCSSISNVCWRISSTRSKAFSENNVNLGSRSPSWIYWRLQLHQGFSAFSRLGATFTLAYWLMGHRVTNEAQFNEATWKRAEDASDIGLLLQICSHITEFSLTTSFINHIFNTLLLE